MARATFGGLVAVLINGNALHIPLADKSVHCCITSPPYWGLRDYGLATWEGGDPSCDHRKKSSIIAANKSTLGPNKDGLGSANQAHQADTPYEHICAKCGAIRHDAGIGLEKTVEDYVANMVQVFREVWRVLRDDGTCWVNMGDSYASSGTAGSQNLDILGRRLGTGGGHKHSNSLSGRAPTPPGLKPKDLCGIPWRVAFALQADGWYLRSDIIWAKPNPMPESVTDRPTKAHEYVFLLSKSKRYFYDADAIRESQKESSKARAAYGWSGRTDDKSNGARTGSTFRRMAESGELIATIPPDGRRNKRTVWTIATAPYSGAHFATFPPKLIEPMVKAGTSERGVCPECGAPWKRVTERNDVDQKANEVISHRGVPGLSPGSSHDRVRSLSGSTYQYVRGKTIGFTPTCSHSHDPIPATVLDPFVGSGTTVQVARSLGRRGIGIDLSPEYLQLARQRLELDKWEDWGRGITDASTYDSLPLFMEGGEG